MDGPALPVGGHDRPSGWRETPAITLARRMLRDLDAKMDASYTDDLQMWLATPAKDRGEPPADPTRLINDITIEMVARWLAAGDGTGGVDADELTEWLRSLSKYRQGGGTDAACWLGLWSTQPWRYQRVGAHIDLLVPRPVITVCDGIHRNSCLSSAAKAMACGPAGCRTCRSPLILTPGPAGRRQHGTPPSRSSTESSDDGRPSSDPEDEFWAHDTTPEAAAEPAALALIHDVFGGEVIAGEGGHRSPIKWRDDGIPAIGDNPACGPGA